MSGTTLDALRAALAAVSRLATENPNTKIATSVARGLAEFTLEVERARAAADQVRLPGGFFDPFEPRTMGRMVALAMLAQPRMPLGGLSDTYGSGVYAIYYEGNHPSYEPISRTETPIYVGKADPADADASTPREQGARLTGRLQEHASTIATVQEYAETHTLPDGLHPISLSDFRCRRLVCATNAQLVAERHLIRIFRPLWNSETKTCWGMSKHGDKSSTRSNKRSPWDVVHPGRDWALNKPGRTPLENALSPDEVQGRIVTVLRDYPPRRDHAALLEEILTSFQQPDPDFAPELPLMPDEDDMGPLFQGPLPEKDEADD